ncbi:MAG: DUF1667 domain-containing protein [Rhodospirillales bacterium]
MTKETANYLCISCPISCHLEVEDDGQGNVVEVRGYTCKKGKTYGSQEHTDPRRMVSTTVPVTGGLFERLPLRTSAEVPRDRVHEICREMRKLTLAAPVRMGQVVLSDILGSGADAIAARDIPLAGQRKVKS